MCFKVDSAGSKEVPLQVPQLNVNGSCRGGGGGLSIFACDDGEKMVGGLGRAIPHDEESTC